MDTTSNASDCLPLGCVRLSHSTEFDSRVSARSRSAQLDRDRSSISSRSLSRGLIFLILIFAICLPSCSTLAQPTSSVSNPNANIPREIPRFTGEIIDDDLREETSQNGNIKDDNAISSGNIIERTEKSLVQPNILSTAGNSNSSMTLPTPFDTLSNNFANSSCISFFQRFLSNSSVTNCRAVSLLLQNSNSFFHVLTSAADTSHLLDTACSKPVDSCAATMNWLASELLLKDNCGPDYEANNSVVRGAFAGLKSYEPLYRSTCLTNPDNKQYCFVDAVLNTTAPDDYNVYFMPLGNTLGTDMVTCTECLQTTMRIYAQWASIDNQPLDTTYLSSAKNVNDQCGAGFASTSVTPGTYNIHVGAGSSLSLPSTRFAGSLLGFALGATLLGMF